ncbi:MAG TPA: penicillin-binding transpeptidase domain-containing protein [Pyrinomonadaceae bacterium]|nr:penicillin-binding transpeptidase domain-containing protein [Pyrinomonadaceae bacterium]
MTLHFHSPKPTRLVFVAFILLSLVFTGTVYGKKKSSAGRNARATNKKATAKSRTAKRGARQVAKSSRRGGSRLSAREVRRQRANSAREQASSLKAMQRRLGRPLTRRERAAALRGGSARSRRALLAARRRAEAARRAAIARQRAIDNALRNEVQALIAKDDISGEDMEVRRVAVNALGHHAGTVVVMDPMTGRVYSVVNQEWALRRGFKPCSTIKLVTGVAGLSENVIPAVDTVGDGYRIDLTSALAHSDNPFFQQVGTKIGSEKMVNYARELGLGEKTGLNVPFEFAGRLPEIKTDSIERRMFSHADGFSVTPLQLGTLVSAMANGGRLLVPQIAHSQKEISKMAPKVRRQLTITPEVWQRMVPGMVGAVNYGSGRKAYDPTQTVAGKTGTCIGDGGWVGLFTSYAPLANPRLAVVVIAQGTDARRHFPAAVAGEIYRQLNHRFGTAINLQVASTLDDEEKEVADAEAAAEETADSMAGETPETSSATPKTPANGNASAPAANGLKTNAPGVNPVVPETRNPVKRVLMPLEKKPEPQKNTTQPIPGAPSVQTEQRPRRTHPNQ